MSGKIAGSAPRAADGGAVEAAAANVAVNTHTDTASASAPEFDRQGSFSTASRATIPSIQEAGPGLTPTFGVQLFGDLRGRITKDDKERLDHAIKACRVSVSEVVIAVGPGGELPSQGRHGTLGASLLDQARHEVTGAIYRNCGSRPVNVIYGTSTSLNPGQVQVDLNTSPYLQLQHEQGRLGWRLQHADYRAEASTDGQSVVAAVRGDGILGKHSQSLVGVGTDGRLHAEQRHVFADNGRTTLSVGGLLEAGGKGNGDFNLGPTISAEIRDAIAGRYGVRVTGILGLNHGPGIRVGITSGL